MTSSRRRATTCGRSPRTTRSAGKQFKEFYEDPENHPLDTPSGKAEIFSKRLYDHYDNHPEIPPVPHFIPEREGHLSDEMKKEYPLQMLMAHPKYRFHGKYNDIEWLRENYKVFGPDGYGYEPVWMNPVDAAERRGLPMATSFCAAIAVAASWPALRITKRLIPGVAWLSYGAWQDPLSGDVHTIDRGGDGNVLANNNPMSVHHVGGAFNSVLFEVEKADLDAFAGAVSRRLRRQVSHMEQGRANHEDVSYRCGKVH